MRRPRPRVWQSLMHILCPPNWSDHIRAAVRLMANLPARQYLETRAGNRRALASVLIWHAMGRLTHRSSCRLISIPEKLPARKNREIIRSQRKKVRCLHQRVCSVDRAACNNHDPVPFHREIQPAQSRISHHGYSAMPTLTIDGRTVQALHGQTVLEAARDAGIVVPTLCYHPDLSPVGSCRLCLVEVDRATRRSRRASCRRWRAWSCAPRRRGWRRRDSYRIRYQCDLTLHISVKPNQRGHDVCLLPVVGVS